MPAPAPPVGVPAVPGGPGSLDRGGTRMTDPASPRTGATDGDPTAALSWQERETLAALQRLARAQSQLAGLEKQASTASAAPPLAASDRAHLEAVHADLEAARAKAGSRFARGARHRVTDLEHQLRSELDRLDLGSWDEYLARRDEPLPPSVDPAVLAFARREVEEAERAWLEMQAIELPPPAHDRDEETATEPADGDGPAAAPTASARWTHPEAS